MKVFPVSLLKSLNLSRLFRPNLFRPPLDGHAPVRALWHYSVALARDPAWYRDDGVADTVPGRFDVITLVLCLVLLRMEQDPALIPPTVLLTELFVEDMDGQLRESGVGDLVVGKHIGKLMGVLGGRLGAYRTSLAKTDNAALLAALTRNVTLLDGADAAALAGTVRGLAKRLSALDAGQVLAGDFSR